MRRTRWPLYLMLLIAGHLVVPAQAREGISLGEEVDAYLAPLLRTNNFAGVVLVSHHGRTIFAKAYGFSDIEQQARHTQETRFQVASLSKPFTSAAILLLAERGKLDLHAPLEAVLPGYPEGKTLSIHHLLSHRSGIPNLNDFPEYEAMQARPHTTEQLVAYFKHKPLEFTPGERYDYSNSNYNLLAHIVEQVSGAPYGEFLENEIAGPLGLRSTAHRVRMTDIVPGLADGYAPRGSLGLERAQYVDWTVKTGNGSLYSTADDLVRFARGLHDAGLLSAASRKQLYTAHSPNVGYGWFLTEVNGKQIHHLNGRSPGWAAQLDHYIADDVTVVVLSNLYSSVATPIARAVGALYFGDSPAPMPALRAEPLKPEDAKRLVGTYRFGADYFVPHSTVTITAKNGQIQAEYPSGYPASAYIPITATRFIVRPFWMPAEFIIGVDGNASELVLGGFTGKRE